MNDVRIEQEFEANLPGLSKPVRICTFNDAQVFVRRWAIRDKNLAVRALVRRMGKANSSETASSAIREMKQELAARGLISRF